MADEIVIRYAADVAKLQAQLQGVENQQLDIEKGAKKSGHAITTESNKAAVAVKKVEKSTHGLKDAFTNLSGNLPFAGAIQQVTQLGGSMGGAVAGVQQLGVAWTALNILFKRSIVGAIVTAIVALITAVTTFFRVSEEGGDKFAKIMSVIGVVTSKVTGVFVELGKAVVGVFEFGFEKAVEFYDFMTETFLKGLTLSAKALRSLGLDEAANKIDSTTAAIKKAKEESEAWSKRLIKLGQDIADIEDSIETKTLDIALANSKLQTQIETTLKALRNTTNTYQENVELIEKIEKADTARFKNNISLIDDEIEAERLKFQKRAVNEKEALDNFNKFVAGQINATELANKADGENTVEQIKGITELLLKKEEANKESELIEVRLNNLREQFLKKDLNQHNQTTLAKVDNLNLVAKTEIDNLELTKKEEEKRDKAKKDSFANFKKMSDDLHAENLKNEEAQTKKLLEEEEKRKAIRQQSVATAIDLFSQLLTGVSDLELQKDLSDIDKEKTINEQKEAEQLASLERRKELGLISEKQLAIQKEKIAKDSAKKDLIIQRKKFEAEKKAKLIGIAIETISGIAKAAATYLSNPLTAPLFPGAAFAIAAEGALAAASVAAQKPPGYKDGVIDLKGKGTGTSDSIPARLSKGESVFTAEETKQHKPLFEAIREGKYDDFMKRNAIVEGAKNKIKAGRLAQEQRNVNSENILKALAANGLVDTSHLERLTKKNKSVKIDNVNEIVEGIQKAVTPKPKRGL